MGWSSMILQWTDGGVASKHVDKFLWYFNLEVQKNLRSLRQHGELVEDSLKNILIKNMSEVSEKDSPLMTLNSCDRSLKNSRIWASNFQTRLWQHVPWSQTLQVVPFFSSKFIQCVACLVLEKSENKRTNHQTSSCLSTWVHLFFMGWWPPWTSDVPMIDTSSALGPRYQALLFQRRNQSLLWNLRRGGANTSSSTQFLCVNLAAVFFNRLSRW